MRRATIGVLVLASAGLGWAGKLPPPMRLTLVPAMCNAVAPASPGPCSTTFAFATGGAVMKALRQPQPTCPKTGRPTESPGADLKMTGVTKNGTLFTGDLDAEAYLKTVFGDDPDGNCELRNVFVGNVQSLVGALSCVRGKCKGKLFPILCLPAQCGDVTIVSELGSVPGGTQTFGPIVVYDDTRVPLATPGTVLAPAD